MHPEVQLQIFDARLSLVTNTIPQEVRKGRPRSCGPGGKAGGRKFR